MEENIQSTHFPTGRRELLFGLPALILALLAADFLLYGGLYLAFALASLGLTLVSWSYLARSGRKIDGYSGALLISGCLCTASMMRSDDGLVKFTMLCFSLVAVNLSLALVAGKNRRNPNGVNSLLDVPHVVFSLGLGELINAFGGLNDARKNAGTFGRKNMAVLAGLAIAVPVLAVLIPLLMRADAAFEGLLSLLPAMDFTELFAVLIFGVPLGCVIYTRNTALVHAKEPSGAEPKIKSIHPLTVTTVLILVTVLYLVYLCSQLAYFVGGFSGILPEEFTMAEYARRGFFEMAWLSAINLGIIALAVGMAEKKEGKTPLAVKLLCLFIAVMTLFFVTAASGKMLLYIGSFGLTRLRVLTQVVMVFIGITVILVAVWLFVPKFAYMKGILLTALVIGAAVAWVDVDTVVAAYNVEAYRSGALEQVDIGHLSSLGDGAVPYLHALTQDDNEAVAYRARQELARRAQYQTDDFRYWNIASARAEDILENYRQS